MLDILGVEHTEVRLNDHQLELYQLWNQAKQSKDFTLADTYRQQLMQENVLV